MSVTRPSRTEGYSDEAEVLMQQYESIAFANVHKQIFHLIPKPPAHVLDIGAGTACDAVDRSRDPGHQCSSGASRSVGFPAESSERASPKLACPKSLRPLRLGLEAVDLSWETGIRRRLK